MVRANAAAALLAQIASSGPGMDLLPAWFPETSPNFNSYVQAEALLVFVYEYQRTGNVAFRDAAHKLATKLSICVGSPTAPPEARSRCSRRRDGDQRQWKLGSHVSSVNRMDPGSVGLARVCGLHYGRECVQWCDFRIRRYRRTLHTSG
jgi:hypothetical protein